MKCLRCGHCCIHYDVIIVKPEHVDLPNLNSQVPLMHKESGKECPHLSWDGDTAICGVHDKTWYKKTPCFNHVQIERSIDNPCRLGEYIRKQGKKIRLS